MSSPIQEKYKKRTFKKTKNPLTIYKETKTLIEHPLSRQPLPLSITLFIYAPLTPLPKGGISTNIAACEYCHINSLFSYPPFSLPSFSFEVSFPFLVGVGLGVA